MPEQLTRGDLLHWYKPGYAHFITYRVTDSLPEELLRELRLERDERLSRRLLPGTDRAEYRYTVHKLMFAKYDRMLDAGSPDSWLSEEAVANVIRENLYHHRGSKYELLAYTIMPNHVHLLIQPFEAALTKETGAGSDSGSVGHEESFENPDEKSVLSGIMHSLKSFTANRANEALGRSGRFWQKESYDHWVRDIDELQRIVAYIAANPVRAGLCTRSHEWKYSSAYDRYQTDGSECALVGWLRDDWRQ